MYLASNLQNGDFYHYFMDSANHDDDKNLTRWTFVQGWKIILQFHPDALIETTLEKDFWGFMNQCARWARGHWRGNFRVMSSCSYWYKVHTYSLYAIYLGQFQTPALLWDGFMFYALAQATAGLESRTTYLIAFVIWIAFTKTIKMLKHFGRNPIDLLVFWIPMVLFSYAHGFINIYALLTLGNTGWGAKRT